MLKSNIEKNIKSNVNYTINNSIELKENLEDKGKGHYFKSRFIEPGFATYSELGTILITKETLNQFIHTMIGCPVIINHKDINGKNADKERVGVVGEVWYDETDGWYYCSGIIWNTQAIDLIKNQGWNVSCSYNFESDNTKGIYNGTEYSMEFIDGEFLHLAIVDNPRYNRANIVVNSKDDIKETEEEKQEEKVINNIERKDNTVMAVMDDLKDFILNVVNNACKDEKDIVETEEKEVENEKEEIEEEEAENGGAGSGDFDHAGRPGHVGGSEKAGTGRGGKYDKKGKKQWTGKNPQQKLALNEDDDDKEEKEEKFEEEKEIANNEEKEEIKEEKEEKKEVKNSMEHIKDMAMGGNSEIKINNGLYTSQAERLELGNKF